MSTRPTISNTVLNLASTRYCLLLVVCARVNRPFIRPARLHCPHFCNTIARLFGNIRPPLDLPLVSHTLYQIGNNNIVQRPVLNTIWARPCRKAGP